MKHDKYPRDADVRCVVLRDKFVLIGAYARDPESGVVTLTDAYVVRRWGTDKGLAQIAIEGVRPETVLDYGGEVEAPWHAVIYTIRCTHTSWRK